MAIELRILSGARAGDSKSFDQSVIAIGRHPGSDFRFDPTKDLDVSTKHAEIRLVDGHYTLADLRSTNGTYVNGARLAEGGSHVLKEGDVVAFGPRGPTLSVHVTPARASSATPGTRRPSTNERVAIAVRHQTRALRIGVLAAIVILGGLAAAEFWMGHRDTAARDAEIGRLLAAYNQASQQLQVRLQGTNDSALIRDLQRHNDSLAGALRMARGTAVASARQAVRRDQELTHALTEMDLPALRDANDPAIVLISTQVGSTEYEATGFNVRPSGLIVTNRHVVSDSATRAARIGVKFANTARWHHAHIVAFAPDPNTDLALLQLDDAGTYPVVHGVATNVDVPVGAPIATIGFPLGTDAPMEGEGASLTAKTTTTFGTVSKIVSDVLQIDAFASHGSSGSPVFDGHGHVVGVVYAGPPGGGGRIVYAVPADQISALIRSGSR